MNRRNDRAGSLFVTDFSEEDRSRCLRTTEEEFVADKGTSEGAAVFMRTPG